MIHRVCVVAACGATRFSSTLDDADSGASLSQRFFLQERSLWLISVERFFDLRGCSLRRDDETPLNLV